MTRSTSTFWGHLNAVATRNLAKIPPGVVVAYTDAAIKGAVARCAVVLVRGDQVSEEVFDPGVLDATLAETAAIQRAKELGAEYVVTDSLAAIARLGKPSFLVFVPGGAEVPLHKRAHNLAVAARKEG